MKERLPRNQSSQPYQSYPVSQNLAQQPHAMEPQDEVPLDADGNVLPMPIKPRSPNPIAEDPLTPRVATKRKSSGAGQGKAQASSNDANFSDPNAGKSKTAKGFRQHQASNHQPFADELWRLEAQADRINQILAERAQKKARTDQSQPIRDMPTQLYAPADLEEEDTEKLKEHAQRVRQRLAELEVAMEAAQRLATSPDQSWAEPDVQSSGMYSSGVYPSGGQSSGGQSSGVHPSTGAATNPAMEELKYLTHQEWGNDQSRPKPIGDRPRQAAPNSADPRVANPQFPDSGVPHQPFANQPFPYHPQASHSQASHPQTSHPQTSHPQASHPQASYQQSSYQQSFQQQFPHQPYSESQLPDRRAERPWGERPSGDRRSLFWLHRLGNSQMFAVPRKPVDWLGDAALWMVVSAIARVGARYLVGLFPVLSPVLLFLMLTPAMLAVFLAIFVPKLGWVPYYRLFLIMLGLLVGGKL